jgi:hypothetical protein
VFHIKLNAIESSTNPRIEKKSALEPSLLSIPMGISFPIPANTRRLANEITAMKRLAGRQPCFGLGWAVGFRTRDNPSGCEDMDQIISICPCSIGIRFELQENSAWIYKFLFLGGVMTFRIGA